MKLFNNLTIVLLLSFLVSSCEKENLPSSEENSFKSEAFDNKIKPNSFNTQKANNITFRLRTKQYNLACHDNQYLDSTYDFDIVFENPTTENLEFIFSVKKNPAVAYSLLSPDITDIFIPAGTRIKTVSSSCGLPDLIDCQYNGQASQNFYIEFVEVSSSSNFNYTTNDKLTIMGYRQCLSDTAPPPKGGGF